MNPLDLDLENSCGNLFRSRANTWPLPRPEITETFISTSSDIPEEKTDSSANVNLCGAPVLGLSGSNNNLSLNNNNNEQTVIPTTAHDASLEHVGSNGSNASSGNQSGGATAKKNSSRRNAWGNMSYADLITQAIQSSPDNRLTLSQIYDWMVQNVLYFKDKGDSNSSAGWKNSIRHNLSLHNRFMRVQNEGTGKSSWWMINPDAKPGKANRRRAQSMETQKYEKKRGRVKKKVEALRNGIALDTTPSPSSSVSEGLDMFPDSPIHHFQLSPDFRPRASSNASSCGHLSPIPAVETDMHDNQVPPLSPLHAWKPDLVRWVSDAQDQLTTEKIVEMANTMKLGGNAYVKTSPIGESLSPNQANVTLGSNSYTTLNSYNTTAMSPYNSGAGTGTLHRNGSDPYFQNPGGIENNITLTSLNSVPSSRSPAKLLSGDNVGSNSTFGQLPNLSPSISPTQSMDIVSNNAHNSINSNFHTPKHNASAHQTQATVQSGGGTYSPNGIENHLIMCANLNSKNLMSSSSNLTSLTSLGTTASQVMGHLLSLNNPLPNDLDFDSLQGGLECDVDQVISHELSVDGNLDFNFDNLHNTSVAPTSVSTSAASHSWVR